MSRFARFAAAGAAGAGTIALASRAAPSAAAPADLSRRRAGSPAAFSGGAVYDFAYYAKAAISGAICCSITHAALTPVDVVKTRIQLDAAKYNSGMVGAFNKIVAEEGMGALLTGAGATAAGYFVQGFFKFGGVEFFKVQFATALGDRVAWDNKTAIYLASSGMAEFVADLFLCPLEAVRIRSVSDPSFPQGLGSGFARILSTEGVGGFYAGLGPILFKQIPYTMAKFAVQGAAADAIFGAMGVDPKTASSTTTLSVALSSGVVAGVAAAIISHPADTLLSKVNKAGAGGEGSIFVRLGRIAAETGIVKLCTVGLAARCVMIGTLTAGQFAIFDTVMAATGAKKFHFHNPDEKAKAH